MRLVQMDLNSRRDRRRRGRDSMTHEESGERKRSGVRKAEVDWEDREQERETDITKPRYRG